MRDLLFPRSTRRRRVSQQVVELFAANGYDLVSTPPFEYAEVLERGIATVDRRDLLRFVEPESGEVALLRPDITPQVARIVATQLRHRPAPWRLSYEGTVVRRRRGRARLQRQIAQAGIECIGIEGPEADAEVVRLAAEACQRVGLQDFRVELGQLAIIRNVLAKLPREAQAPVAAAMERKDHEALTLALREVDSAQQIDPQVQRELLALVDLYGAVDVLPKARLALRGVAEQQHLDRLDTVIAQLRSLGLGDRLSIDLGEVRGRSYYTGIRFTLLAPGPGEPVVTGGRYDALLERYGLPAPATGFALDLDNLEWALESAGIGAVTAAPWRIVVADVDAPRQRRLAQRLRDDGCHVAELPVSKLAASSDGNHGDDACERYARAWSYDVALHASGSGWQALRLEDGERITFAADSAAEATHGLNLQAVLGWVQQKGSTCQR